MKKSNISIDLLPNQFLNGDGTFDKESAMILSGKIAGVCYDKEGFNHIDKEDKEKTLRRIDRTLNSGHHSVYDHIKIIFNLHHVPKIIAMILNNEKDYSTSEKSARYTKVVGDNLIISVKEEELYNKWMNIFITKIKSVYGDTLSEIKIKKLAQENARYLVTVFMPTEMIYTTSLRQINYIASFFQRYIKEHNGNSEFESKLSNYMSDFLLELERLNILDEGLMKNEKNRSISLFGKDLDKRNEIFDYVYSTNYKATFAELAQAQRHRTINYQMELMKEKEYFIPPILSDQELLVEEWLNDIYSVKEVNPQGELIHINEVGTFDNFILKCKERLCSEAQLEICNQENRTLNKYREALIASKHYLAEEIEKYSHGARCTFPCYKCSNDCKFKEGKRLTRKI